MQPLDPSRLTPHTPELIPVLSISESEVSRQMQICNACRYCEGFCAVFPAMTRRLDFTKADIHYLANLCHNCGACLTSCQYAEPHEFAVNVPKSMAQVRLQTYGDYAWPAAFGRAYQNNGLVLALAAAGGLGAFLLLTLTVNGSLMPIGLGANFYAIFPHNTLALMFGVVFAYVIMALTIAVTRFWRSVTPAEPEPLVKPVAAGLEATGSALTLQYLDGGHGKGCTNEDDRFTLWRRRMHHFTFYGFMLCLASTSVATLYHYLGDLHAPYPFFSIPVLLGTLGGIGLVIGPAGLLWLNVRRNPEQGDVRQRPMDRAFIALLLWVSLTGLGLLAWRDTNLMAILLAVHLGAVMAFFLTMPYGKFAHGVFRSAALLKNSIEKRQPDRLKLGSD